jgi:hypothetical protein
MLCPLKYVVLNYSFSFFCKARSYSAGTAQGTALSHATWTRPQEVLEGCQVNWLQAVRAQIILCFQLLTEKKKVFHRIFIPCLL